MNTEEIKVRVDRITDAVDAHAFLGAQPPEDHADIEEEYAGARKEIVRALAELQAYRDVVANYAESMPQQMQARKICATIEQRVSKKFEDTMRAMGEWK